MAKEPPAPREFVDYLGDFSKGVNNDVSPLILPKDQLASALNSTVRGTFITQRSIYRNIKFDAASQTLINSAFGAYQGGCFYKPDTGMEQIAVEIGGNFLLITPSNSVNTATVMAPPYAGGAVKNPSTPPQAWLWQSENFVIVQDGVSNPLFYDGTNIFRSQWGAKVSHSTYSTGAPANVVPAIGATFTLTVNSTANMASGIVVIISNIGSFLIQSVTDGTHVVLVNQTALVGTSIPDGSAMANNVFFAVVSAQLPPGRQGAYIMGRNVFFLPDGKQFVVSDQVGGSSGTQPNNFRDAVLQITENLYLAGGGNFALPGSIGEGTAVAASAQMDASLGQGPGVIATRSTIFSLNLPTDRLTWQDVTTPILAPAVIDEGATGQYSTISVNSDLVYRSPFGIRSEIIARRDFNVWGNTQQSREIEPLLSTDNPGLLQYESAIVFDNRYLLTIQPQQIAQGVIHTSLAVINLDPLSSLQGKAPSVYDSLQWTGLNVFQLFTGTFNLVQRAFALTWNTITGNCELYEILPSANTAYLDNDVVRIVWGFESSSLFRDKGDDRTFKRLVDGEINVDELQGTVDFQSWYKPDQYPCWVPWHQWQECWKQPVNALQPGYRPRMGLGEPSSKDCDIENNQPLRNGFTFQFRMVITGKVRFLGGRFKAIEEPEPLFAKPSCNPICPT